jgi:hypothetical protein
MNPTNFIDPMGMEYSNNPMDWIWYAFEKAFGHRKQIEGQVSNLIQNAGQSSFNVIEGGLNMLPAFAYWIRDIFETVAEGATLGYYDVEEWRFRFNLSEEGSSIQYYKTDNSGSENLKNATIIVPLFQHSKDLVNNVYTGYMNSNTRNTDEGKSARDQVEKSLIPTGFIVYGGIKGAMNSPKIYSFAKGKIALASDLINVVMYIKKHGRLPEKFITKQQAKQLGWKGKEGNLADVAPGKSIGGDIFNNKQGKLPEAAGRIWYEADLGYISGFRNKARIVYSNDGLIYATFDHYQSFNKI